MSDVLQNFLEIAAARSFPVIPTMCFIPQIVNERFKNEVYGMNCEDSVPSCDRNQQQ